MLCLLGLIFKIPIVEQLMVSTQAAKRASRYARLDAAYVCATMLPRQVEMQSIIKGQGEQDPAPDRRRSP